MVTARAQSAGASSTVASLTRGSCRRFTLLSSCPASRPPPRCVATTRDSDWPRADAITRPSTHDLQARVDSLQLPFAEECVEGRERSPLAIVRRRFSVSTRRTSRPEAGLVNQCSESGGRAKTREGGTHRFSASWKTTDLSP